MIIMTINNPTVAEVFPMSQISIGPYKGVGFIRGLIQGLIDGALQNLMFLYIKLMLKHFKY